MFGTASCAGECLHRLGLLDEVESAKKLFVIEDIADHSRLRKLGRQFPGVAISMGVSAASLDNFIAQFDTDNGKAIDKQQQLYLINPLAELVYSLPQQGLKSGDIDRELAFPGL